MFRRRTLSVAFVAALVVAGSPAGLAEAATSTATTPTAATPAATSTALATTPTTPTVPPTTPTTTSTTPATPPPVSASVRLYLPDVFFVEHEAVTVPGRVIHVGGVVRPYVAGQWVVLRAFLGHRLIKSERVALKRSRDGRYGHFTARLSSPGAGEVVVKVKHAASPQMLAFTSQRRFATLDERIGFGSTGRFVELIQQRLAALHFYIPQTGVYDQGTGLALDAYHRLLGGGEGHEALDGKTISFLLDGFGAFKVRYPRHGDHAEANLSLQVLALVSGSHVYEIFPISSGKPSTPTVLGNFQVYSKVPGYLPDGMYYSNFFFRGYAIHGYDPAPDYPASHGCLRLPIVDATTAYGWLKIGNWVDVYY